MSHAEPTAAAALDAPTVVQMAELMHALGTRSRLLILGALRAGPLAVGDIAARVGMEQSAVSQQLRVLRHLGLVVGDRRGRYVFYALHDPHLAMLLDEAASHVAHRRLGLADPVRPARAEDVA